MNFYKRYMADYARKTARLSLSQHGAYTLLLDEMYATESGLPSDMDSLFRICRAMTKQEQEAVRSVAEAFFPVGADGLRWNQRALDEITDAGPAMEAARLNGKKGGRPKNETKKKPSGFPENNQPDNPPDNPVGFQCETHHEPSSKPPQNSDTSSSLRSEDAARIARDQPIAGLLPEPSAKPPTGDQPTGKPPDKPRSRPDSAVIAALDGVPPTLLADYRKVRAAKRAGPLTDTAVAGLAREAAKAGISLADAITACCENGWQGFRADWYADRLAAGHRRTTGPSATILPGGKFAGAARAIFGDQSHQEVVDV